MNIIMNCTSLWYTVQRKGFPNRPDYQPDNNLQMTVFDLRHVTYVLGEKKIHCRV